MVLNKGGENTEESLSDHQNTIKDKNRMKIRCDRLVLDVREIKRRNSDSTVAISEEHGRRLVNKIHR